jgi:M6 family metalloprotease-like protein
VVLLLALVYLGAAGSAAGGLVSVKRPPEDPELKRVQQARMERWLNPPVRDMWSSRDLLKRSRGQYPELLGAGPGGGTDTLRICVVRVEFASVPDPSKISGNGGRFDLSTDREGIPIDPPPHDRKYLMKHMEALDYYYRTMSYGSLVMEWEVFPLDNDSAYVLPDVGKYNPEGGIYTWELEGLESFFIDTIEEADRDSDLTFGDFDAVVICHAGSDWQNDIRGDSPYDLPSFFISLAESLWVDVDGGEHQIVDGSVIPETTSQDGYFNGINGVTAHEVGHQLGLPDLYDTYTGLSVVGYWDLMDFGSGIGVVLEDEASGEAYYVSGIVPGSISTWCKAYLGWVRLDTAETSGWFTLRATELQEGSPNGEALMVPVSSYEYYLIENRQGDLDGDGTGYLLTDPSADSTGVIVGPVNADKEFNYEFDFVLPGSGLLIWHVDSVMVNFGNPYDIVNAYAPRRGITMVEADGIPDLGDFNSFYFLGSEDDPFRAGNNDRFADDTTPSTTTRNGCRTHITIDRISESAISMDLNVTYEWRRDGFPVALGDSMRFGVPALLAHDLDGDGRGEIFAGLRRVGFVDSVVVDTVAVDSVVVDTVGVVVDLRAEMYGYRIDAGGALVPAAGWPRRLYGTLPTEIAAVDLDGDSRFELAFGDDSRSLYVLSADGTPYFQESDSLGSPLRFAAGINGAPVARDLDGDGAEELLVATDSALVVLRDAGGPGPEQVFSILGSSGFSQPVVVDFRDGAGYEGLDIVTYSEGSLRVISGDGASTASIPLSAESSPDSVHLAAADLDRDEGEDHEIVVATGRGQVVVVDREGEVAAWGRELEAGIVSPPGLADVDGDGYLEIVVNDQDQRIWVLLYTGAALSGWPNTWYGCSLPVWDDLYYPYDWTIPVASPLLADLDCDGRINVVQGSLFECIVTWEPGGDRTSGFPLGLGGGCSATVLADLDGDGALDLIAGGGDGHLYGFTHPESEDGCAAPWRMAGFDRSRNAVYPVELMPEEPEPGSRLYVRDTFHVYPNPATGNTVTFTFETETGGMATVEVFDVNGVLVKSVGIDATAFTSKVEIRDVGIGDLASGLYMCRLRLDGDARSASEFFKLAVKR